MYHYGGGYINIKYPLSTLSWIDSFYSVNINDNIMGNISQRPQEASIFKPYTSFTEEWYNHLNLFLDNVETTDECFKFASLEEVFNHLLTKYKKDITNTLPITSVI